MRNRRPTTEMEKINNDFVKGSFQKINNKKGIL